MEAGGSEGDRIVSSLYHNRFVFYLPIFPHRRGEYLSRLVILAIIYRVFHDHEQLLVHDHEQA
jgi:hypothetical protein